MPEVTRYAVGVLLRKQHILLGKRVKNRKDYPECWSFFGGHCLPDETYEACLRREIQEELGVQVTDYTFLKYYDYAPRMQFQVFAIHQWQGEPENTAPEEHDVIQWFSLDDVDQLKVAAETYKEVFSLLRTLE